MLSHERKYGQLSPSVNGQLSSVGEINGPVCCGL